MIRNIIFDWSGTLVDDLPAVWQATNYVLTQAGRPEMTLDEFRAEFCLPFTRFYERYTPHVPVAQLEAWFHASFRQVQHSVVELPHARAFLEFCRERALRTFVLSTVHRDYYAAQTSSNGFHEFIERAYLEIWNKREQIHQVLLENKLAPQETLFIGDMQHDIETARHGGILSCGVLTGYNTLMQLRAAEPDLIVEHLGELKGVLERGAMELKHGGTFGARREAERHAALAEPSDNPKAVSSWPCASTSATAVQKRGPVATVGALIYNARREVLMVRTPKWSHRWGIPGGKIKFGETAVEALRREIKEETNLAIRDIKFVLVQDCIHSKEFYRDEHFLLLNYTCRATGKAKVILNEEAVEFRWVTPGEALTMDLNQPTRVLLKAVK